MPRGAAAGRKSFCRIARGGAGAGLDPRPLRDGLCARLGRDGLRGGLGARRRLGLRADRCVLADLADGGSLATPGGGLGTLGAVGGGHRSGDGAAGAAPGFGADRCALVFLARDVVACALVVSDDSAGGLAVESVAGAAVARGGGASGSVLGVRWAFALAFLGLAWSFYPWVVPDRRTLDAAAAAPESLRIILWGAVLVLPGIGLYTAGPGESSAARPERCLAEGCSTRSDRAFDLPPLAPMDLFETVEAQASSGF